MLNGSEDGLALVSVEADCSGVQIYGGRYAVVVSNSTVSFSDCVFFGSRTYTSGVGINLQSPTNVVLTRSVIVDSEYGIISRSMQHSLNITDCIFINNSAAAIHLVHSYWKTVTPATLLLYRNQFSGNSRAVHVVQNAGIDILVEAADNTIEESASASGRSGMHVSGVFINLQAVGKQASVTIQKNTFRNLPHSAVSISRCHHRSSLLRRFNHSTTVIENNFARISHTAVVIRCADTTATLIQRNTFLENMVNAGPSSIDLSLRALGNVLSTELSIDHNEFRENLGTYIGKIAVSGRSSLSSDGVLKISEFVFNTLVDNVPRNSTIYSEHPDLRMHFNTFSNQKARYELWVGFPENQVANCTFNWWGVGTEAGIAARVFDHSDMASVGSVLYVPFLNSSQFSCAQLSDCSGHGICVHLDTCRCDIGWSGQNCSTYSCVEVYDCSSRGRCVGPNLCSCDSGWLEPDCSRASCILQRNCSNRGVCSLPNV